MAHNLLIYIILTGLYIIDITPIRPVLYEPITRGQTGAGKTGQITRRDEEETMASPLPTKQQEALDDLLKDAVRDKNLPRVLACLSRGASPGCTVFHESFSGKYNYRRPLSIYAYECYDAAVFEALAKAGLPLEAKDPEGRTALHRAVLDFNRAAVEQMLKLGASPLSEDRYDTTILTAARPSADSMRNDNREKIVDLLIAALSPAGDFNKAADPAAPAGIADDLTVMKPITLNPRKDGGGLNL